MSGEHLTLHENSSPQPNNLYFNIRYRENIQQLDLSLSGDTYARAQIGQTSIIRF